MKHFQILCKLVAFEAIAAVSVPSGGPPQFRSNGWWGSPLSIPPAYGNASPDKSTVDASEQSLQRTTTEWARAVRVGHLALDEYDFQKQLRRELSQPPKSVEQHAADRARALRCGHMVLDEEAYKNLLRRDTGSNARGTDTTLGTATALASTGAPGGFFMSLYHGLRNYYMQNDENLVRGFMVGGLPYNPESRRKNIITENATKQNGTSVKSNEQRDREFEAMFASNGVAFDVARSPNSRVTEAVVSDPPIDSN